MNDIKYTICRANQTQREYIWKHSAIKNKKAQENAIIYVALDENNSVIGRIIMIKQDISSPIAGRCGYIADLFVHPEHRRQGIATALFQEIIKQAARCNINYCWGHARPTLEANMFWLNQGVTMHPSGTMPADANQPLYDGNYWHVFSYCIHRKILANHGHRIHMRAITKDETADLINKYTEKESKKTHLLSKADELLGFAAVGENEQIKGVILAFPQSMKAPLDSTYWVVSLYVDPQFRHQGIGTSLVWQLFQYARKKGVLQITCFTVDEHIGFWYKLGFDIHFRGKNTQGTMLATAMIRT